MAINLQVIDRLKSQLLTSGTQEKNNALFQVINQLIETIREVAKSIPTIPEAEDTGGGVAAYFFRADTTNIAANDPGAGRFKYNNATQASATTLFFDWLTEDDFDVHILFEIMEVGNRFVIQDADLGVSNQVWELTGPAINHPDWFEVPVSFVSGTTTFSNNQRVAVLLAFVGGGGSPSPPLAHHVTHEFGGTDELVNAAWKDRINVFTSNQVIAPPSPENASLEIRGSTSRGAQIGLTDLVYDPTFPHIKANIAYASKAISFGIGDGLTDDCRMIFTDGRLVIMTPEGSGAPNVSPELVLQKTFSGADTTYPRLTATPGLVTFWRLNFSDRVSIRAAGLDDTPLNASNLASGTVPIARLPTIPTSPHHATHETGGSDAITALSGAVITSGTVADARLSTQVVFNPSPALIGIPTAPTAAIGTSTTQIATTEFVRGEVAPFNPQGKVTSPPPNSSLTSSTATFAWNAGIGVSGYYLWIGSSIGTSDLWEQFAGSALSMAVTGLPMDGRILYVRLWSVVSGDFLFTDYFYNAAHHITHESSGTDALDVKNLAGYPGDTTKYLRGDATFQPIASSGSGGSTTVTTVGNIDDLVFTGSIIRMNNTTQSTIRGLAAGTDGQTVTIVAIGAGNVNLSHQNVSSSSGNRLNNFVTSADISLIGGLGYATFEYDLSLGYWKQVNFEQGDWIPVAYDANNFQGGDSSLITIPGAWTVESGDQFTYSYKVVGGKTMVVSFNIINTSVTSGPIYFKIKIPGGFIALGSFTYKVRTVENGTLVDSRCVTINADTFLYIVKENTVAWATSTNATAMQGTLMFRIT